MCVCVCVCVCVCMRAHVLCVCVCVRETETGGGIKLAEFNARRFNVQCVCASCVLSPSPHSLQTPSHPHTLLLTPQTFNVSVSRFLSYILSVSALLAFSVCLYLIHIQCLHSSFKLSAVPHPNVFAFIWLLEYQKHPQFLHSSFKLSAVPHPNVFAFIWLLEYQKSPTVSLYVYLLPF